jgi:hypothetical protein
MFTNFAGCKYDRKAATWSECGPGVLSRKKVMSLKPGESPNCPPTRTKTKPCKGRSKAKVDRKERGRNKKNRKGAAGGRKKGKGKG